MFQLVSRNGVNEEKALLYCLYLWICYNNKKERQTGEYCLSEDRNRKGRCSKRGSVGSSGHSNEGHID